MCWVNLCWVNLSQTELGKNGIRRILAIVGEIGIWRKRNLENLETMEVFHFTGGTVTRKN